MRDLNKVHIATQVLGISTLCSQLRPLPAEAQHPQMAEDVLLGDLY